MPVRIATLHDIPALARVINRAYVVEAHLFVGDRTNETEIRDRLEKPNARFLVIDDDAPEAEPRLRELSTSRFAVTVAISACCPSIQIDRGVASAAS